MTASTRFSMPSWSCLAFDVFFGNLSYGHVVGDVVVFGGDYHVVPSYHALRVNFVVVN